MNDIRKLIDFKDFFFLLVSAISFSNQTKSCINQTICECYVYKCKMIAYIHQKNQNNIRCFSATLRIVYMKEIWLTKLHFLVLKILAHRPTGMSAVALVLLLKQKEVGRERCPEASSSQYHFKLMHTQNGFSWLLVFFSGYGTSVCCHHCSLPRG